MLLLENNPIFMFAIIQIPDKTIHRRTEDAGDEDDRDERSVFLQIQILVDWMWIPLDCYDYYSTCSAKKSTAEFESNPEKGRYLFAPFLSSKYRLLSGISLVAKYISKQNILIVKDTHITLSGTHHCRQHSFK